METNHASRKYHIHDYYMALYKGFKTMRFMRKASRENLVSKDFSERIMLAVTQVNDCEVCSYAHTKMALEQGMSGDEIQKILAGDMEDIPPEEAPAIFFAQHYADSRGKPSPDSWQRLQDEYGKEKALGILGATRMIMIGNIIGIPISSFKNRLNGKKVEKSNIFYELGLPLSTIILMPIAFLHSLLARLFKFKIV